MRTLAGILVTSGLIALSWGALSLHDLAIAALGIALAALWGLAITLRWPKAFHTAYLGSTAFLCALSASMEMPALIPLFCVSATLTGWDLALMDLRMRTHPRKATFVLTRKYALRCLSLAGLGFGAALLARVVHVRMSFFSALAVSCLCLMLFLVIHRRARTMMNERPSATTPEMASAVPEMGVSDAREMGIGEEKADG